MAVQAISVVTLGIGSLERSRRFYGEGFGWKTVFENEESAVYQMNGFVLGTFRTPSLEADMSRSGLVTPGAFSETQKSVVPQLAQNERVWPRAGFS